MKKNNLLIIEIKNKNIGQISLEFIKYKAYVIDIFILKEYRKKGIASIALKMSEQLLEKKAKIISIVKKNNWKSYKFFISNDYKMIRNNNLSWCLQKTI